MILKEKCVGSSKKQNKRQKRMSTNIDEKCPLCLEVLELDDLNFYPCTCGYQVCRFCWHRIRTNENCLCPACRRQYPEDPVTFKPLTQEELQKVKNEKKMKEMQKKKEIAESRKQLANIRVVQKNLVYVHGLPVGLDTDEDRYRKIEKIFKDFGPVAKCIINNKTNYAGSQSHRASAYVTYQKIDDALRAFKNLPNLRIEGHDIKTSLGTTKYCSNFLKNVHCPKQDCMYLHEVADEELCFTKEQIHAGEHLACGVMLYDRMIDQIIQRNNHNTQLKEQAVVEQEIEPEKQSPEKIKLTEEISENSEESNLCPMQSKLQHLFSNREAESSVFDYKPSFPSNFDSPSSESISSNGDRSSEGSTTNCAPSPAKNFHSFPAQVPLRNGEGFRPLSNGIEFNNEHRGVIGGTANPQLIQQHQQQNGLLSDFGLSSSGATTSAILSRLPIYNSNGTSGPLSDSFESSFEQFDDDLGFDPCQVSLQGLEDLLISEAQTSAPRQDAPPRNSFAQRLPQPPSSAQQQLLRLKQLQQRQQQQQRNNPPPGFSGIQPQHSPGFESRNTLPNRIAPVLNASNSFNGIRPNFQMPRFQQAGMSLNTNSLANGFSPQPIRSFPQQPPSIHDMVPRSLMSSQQSMQSQRFDSLSQLQSQQQPLQQRQQFPTGDHNNLSPTFWNNMNQSQWMSAENCFQNQGLQDIQPASPLLNLRRLPQIRPNDVNRQVQQQLNLRYNLSPFSDNPHFLVPNNAAASPQHNNQLTKGVHTFP
ncbi:hypothetical protein JTE90_020511 [Oedothorax gibbosus]|uniref:CCR4-NOT transcription complex subunit 4 n=1 Tax=Oedothorax gibbosus TaxID=931172 RepID=A0AAV6UT57_9ARAC|nr:hypothetical protein JTE90_020511 [Oedothorax gibbosus]